jgi:hypothetical protein
VAVEVVVVYSMVPEERLEVAVEQEVIEQMFLVKVLAGVHLPNRHLPQ